MRQNKSEIDLFSRVIELRQRRIRNTNKRRNWKNNSNDVQGRRNKIARSDRGPYKKNWEEEKRPVKGKQTTM